MIYMEPHQLGWTPLRDSYMNTLPESLISEHRELVKLHTCTIGSLRPFMSLFL